MRVKINFLLSAILILFSICLAFAGTPVDVAKNALSARLKKDLALELVTVQLSQVQTYNISKNLIGLRGNGKANDLDISFEVKLNKTKLVPTDVEYQFIAPGLPSAFSEDVLIRDLLNELNKDFKTKNIVIGVDSFDSEKIENNKMKISGNGEVRINFDWKKLKFEILKSEKLNAPVKIKYQIY
jgi:hypothetical protein